MILHWSYAKDFIDHSVFSSLKKNETMNKYISCLSVRLGRRIRFKPISEKTTGFFFFYEKEKFLPSQRLSNIIFSILNSCASVSILMLLSVSYSPLSRVSLFLLASQSPFLCLSVCLSIVSNFTSLTTSSLFLKTIVFQLSLLLFPF